MERDELVVIAKIDLKKLVMKWKSKGKRFISVRGVANELCISSKSAGRIMKKLERNGLVSKWSDRVYELNDEVEWVIGYV